LKKGDSLEEKLKKETHKKLSPFTIIILFHGVDISIFPRQRAFHNIRHKEEEEEEAFSIFSSALLANHLEPKKQN
jgi:hypothetical protein